MKEKRERELALQQAETDMLRQRRSKISVKDFENIKLIGRGAFGEVKKKNFFLTREPKRFITRGKQRRMSFFVFFLYVLCSTFSLPFFFILNSVTI